MLGESHSDVLEELARLPTLAHPTVGPDGETGSSRSTSTSRPDTDRRDDGPVIADAPPATTAKGLQQSV